MAASASLYGHSLVKAFAKAIDLTSDTLKIALLGTGYTPNLNSDVFWGTISSHEVSGTGYTAGGLTLSSTAVSLTKASTWGHSRAATTAYTYGQIVRPASANGSLYRCVAAGTTGSGTPSYPTTVGLTVTDGTVTWANVGDELFIFTSATPAWAALTVSGIKYAAIYDTSSGTASTDPLICLQTLTPSQSPSAQGLSIAPDSILGWFAYPLV